MDFLNVYYVLAAVFGIGLASISAYGLRHPDFMKDKSLAPIVAISVLLFSATLGSAVYGAIQEENHEKEEAAEKAAEKQGESTKAGETEKAAEQELKQ